MTVALIGLALTITGFLYLYNSTNSKKVTTTSICSPVVKPSTCATKENKTDHIHWEQSLTKIFATPPIKKSPDSIFIKPEQADLIASIEQEQKKVVNQFSPLGQKRLDFLKNKNKELVAELEATYFLWHATLDENKKLKQKIKFTKSLATELSNKELTSSDSYKYFNI